MSKSQTYVILNNLQHGMSAILCLVCGSLSYNPNDVREKYCGKCHQLHEFMTLPAQK